MDEAGLDKRAIALWRAAADDLGIRVTAPAELRDAEGRPFACEAFVPDFGSPTGAAVMSAKTERRLRPRLRALGDRLWVSVEPRRQPSAYVRGHFIRELEDWGWFGAAGAEPDWYVDRR